MKCNHFQKQIQCWRRKRTDISELVLSFSDISLFYKILHTSYTGWDNEKCTSLLGMSFKAIICETCNKQSQNNNYYILLEK